MVALTRSAGRLISWSRKAEVPSAALVILITVMGLCFPFVIPRPIEPSENPTLETVLIVCLTAPFAEEFLFRGFLQPLIHKLCDLHIERPDVERPAPSFAPNFVTSVIFVSCHAAGSSHPTPELLGIFFASLALGAMSDRGIRLPLLVAIHGSWNLALLIAGSMPAQA